MRLGVKCLGLEGGLEVWQLFKRGGRRDKAVGDRSRVIYHIRKKCIMRSKKEWLMCKDLRGGVGKHVGQDYMERAEKVLGCCQGGEPLPCATIALVPYSPSSFLVPREGIPSSLSPLLCLQSRTCRFAAKLGRGVTSKGFARRVETLWTPRAEQHNPAASAVCIVCTDVSVNPHQDWRGAGGVCRRGVQEGARRGVCRR